MNLGMTESVLLIRVLAFLFFATLPVLNTSLEANAVQQSVDSEG